MHALLNNGWTEDIGTWLIGLLCGAALANHHIVMPARRRHAELLRKHAQHEDRLAAIERRAGA